jgi:hypothetical protein
MLPYGRVLVAVGPGVDGFNNGATFYEYDPLVNTLTQVPTPANAGGAPYNLRMLLIPTGQVLLSASGTDAEVYTPDGEPEEDWRPIITSCPLYVRTKQTYHLSGIQLNGLSQGSCYGDDASVATNYPIVRIRSEADGKDYFCRTFDHSTMGVATGADVQHTSFKIPFDVPDGPADLVVIANGIASEPFDINVTRWRLQFPVTEGLVNRLIGSLADGPLWVLGPNGPIPVDPGWGEMEKEAKLAWEKLIEAARTLSALGEQADQRQTSELPTAHKHFAKRATSKGD